MAAIFSSVQSFCASMSINFVVGMVTLPISSSLFELAFLELAALGYFPVLVHSNEYSKNKQGVENKITAQSP